MKRIIALVSLLAFAGAASAQDKVPDGATVAREVAPFLDEQVIAVEYVDLTRLDPEPLLKALAPLGLPKEVLAELRGGSKEVLGQIEKAGLKRAYVVVSLAHMPDQPPLIVLPLDKGADAGAATRLLEEITPLKVERGEGVLLAGSRFVLSRVPKGKPAPRAELARALDGDAPIRLAFLPTDELRRAFEEVIPALPRAVGGVPSGVLTRGLRWAAVNATLSPTPGVSLVIQTESEASALAIRAVLAASMKELEGKKELLRVWPDFKTVSEKLLPKADGDRLTLKLANEELLALAVPVVKAAREEADRQVRTNNLRQIGLAFHSYHDTHNGFPASASYDKQGKPLLSWRVHLLPYLDQEALYKQFKLDEPWDSEHNKKLIPMIPGVYTSAANPRLAQAGRTTYVVPTGPGTAFAGKTGLKLTKVTDGTSNTILATEADDEHAVVWTKPDDIRVDPQEPARGLRRYGERGILILLMDGSARHLPATLDAKSLSALFTPTGGEAVPLP
jgi:hypothetical protein